MCVAPIALAIGRSTIQRCRVFDLMAIHIMPNDERNKLQMGEDKDQTNDGRNETGRRLDVRRDKVGKLEEDVARR